MGKLYMLLFLIQPMISYTQNKQDFSLTNTKTIELSEVIVFYEDMYDIYKKAASNLKKKLIKGKEITYKIQGKEEESIAGEERYLEVLLTAQLQSSNIKKNRLKYQFLLSHLEYSSNVFKSIIMKRNRYCVPLFYDNILTEMKINNLNTIEYTDSLIYIYDNSKKSEETACYTISKEDTTLIGIDIKKLADIENDDYTSRLIFKSKRLSGNISVEYSKNSQGYYLSKIKIIGSRFFIYRRTKKEELVNLDYEVSALLDTIVIANTKFTPSTYQIFESKK